VGADRPVFQRSDSSSARAESLFEKYFERVERVPVVFAMYAVYERGLTDEVTA
jgi:hypothetical protein